MLDLSNLFKSKAKHAAADFDESSNPTDDADEFRGTKVRNTIDPVDGKTKACNRAQTFDTFVHQSHLGEEELPKKKPTGNSWGVAKAIAKLKGLSKRSSAKVEKKPGSEGTAERE
ncbi:hypothetical protein K504DRAFT_460178 [Pleomassaria siparia CBS 279.74]|uniref:Uncharacterized protein n=1 Tax=Pleomassaria siparia CBS 279.74 TaxID=1314801 RepID=A0A6G1JP89_9PLEO|nr:hypothetical protein K504DRAFT_460178 [Pleomassaria siparia CBS 279.74]